ncbi:hypothetical protein QQ008_02755 [Fulvivirgaceae bacterium BMA10]|uniref:Uncharacterized protein n=1 Tax=Splendidivirga corallicola TaxID=3051826 RepID=A0ABT8KHS7_9BACT|nr:hypothetical protein [Fulvivirgaceae bacterium BMA10]
MIELHISPKETLQLRFQERLEEMTVSHKVILHDTLKEPILKQGKELYTGIETINDFLKELEIFMQQWYECRCDKYEFD